MKARRPLGAHQIRNSELSRSTRTIILPGWFNCFFFHETTTWWNISRVLILYNRCSLVSPCLVQGVERYALFFSVQKHRTTPQIVKKRETVMLQRLFFKFIVKSTIFMSSCCNKPTYSSKSFSENWTLIVYLRNGIKELWKSGSTFI